MSLPPGASLTTIEGKRCTAIPKAAAAVNGSSIVTTSPAPSVAPPVAASTRGPSPAATPAASPAADDSLANPPDAFANANTSATNTGGAAGAGQSTTTSVQAESVANSPSTQLTASSPPPSVPISDSTQDTISGSTPGKFSVPETFNENLSVTRPPSSPQTASSLPSSTPSIAAQTSGPSTQALVSQTQNAYSYQGAASTPAYIPSIQTGGGPVQSSTNDAAGLFSSPHINIGAVVGGVLGGLAFIGIILFVLGRFYKRKKSRDSLLTPLTGSFNRRTQLEKYEFDGDSVGPTPLGKRWKAQAGGFCSRIRMDLSDLGSAAKRKLTRESDVPGVNMNRGNSQFLEPIQQHSRSSSAVSGAHETVLTTRDRFTDWWQRLTEDINFNWRLRQRAKEPLDDFAATRSMDDDNVRTDVVSPNFSHFLVMKDQEFRQSPERHRRSQSTTTLPQLGSLGLDFGAGSDPFADPLPNAQPTIPNLFQPQGVLAINPFADPVPKVNTSDYISNVRRSRGLSQPIPRNSGPATRLPYIHATTTSPISRYPSMAAPSSRYPSTIRTSQGSSRDTIFSGLSSSGRKAKGRSDPFDLDCPDLLQLYPSVSAQSQTEKAQSSSTIMQPRIDSVHAGKPRIVSNAETYSSSKYSSGASAIFHQWGDPGPDFGPVAWRKPGTEDIGTGSNDATRGSAVSSGQGSQIITVGRAL